MLGPGNPLAVTPEGELPYQAWRLPYWHKKLRYAWIVGNGDFRSARNVELILYFHGMHAKNYYRAFREQLESLAKKRKNRPFVFVGFVDTPYVKGKDRGKHRWMTMVPDKGARPDRLLNCINHVYRAFCLSFPRVRHGNTKIVLAGFSGGGRVLDSVGQWLARGARTDPYVRVFRARLSKIAYFDCWFDPAVLETVPALLKKSPRIKIVGTVHMKKPKEHASKLAGKLKLRKKGKSGDLVGHDGRLSIFKDKSHWKAMISRLSDALEI
jgi:hypothetical protein